MIDEKKLIETVNKFLEKEMPIVTTTKQLRIIIAELIEKQPTVNIIHCKDCKHWGTGIARETDAVKCCEFANYMVGANGFCVYGKEQ